MHVVQGTFPEKVSVPNDGDVCFFFSVDWKVSVKHHLHMIHFNVCIFISVSVCVEDVCMSCMCLSMYTN